MKINQKSIYEDTIKVEKTLHNNNNAEQLFADLCKDKESCNKAVEEYTKIKREFNALQEETENAKRALEEEKQVYYEKRKKQKEKYEEENIQLRIKLKDLVIENAFLKEKKKKEAETNFF